MTREDALEFIAQSIKSDVDMAKVADAIKALEQEPQEPMVEIDLYSIIKQTYIEREVLDKIRAEIEQRRQLYEVPMFYTEVAREQELSWALEVIDKYQSESEEKDDKDN